MISEPPLETQPLSAREQRRIERFVVLLGKTMHEYGTPSHRLERILISTIRQLGMDGDFLSSPTTLTFVFWQPGSDDQSSHISRVMPGGLDLNRLAQTHDLAEKVLAGDATIEQGFDELRAIKHAKEPYAVWLQFIAWGVTSAGFAALCGTAELDIIASMFAGWLVFLLIKLVACCKFGEELLEPFSAMLIGFLASAAVASGIDLNVPAVVLSGVIAFVPGLSLTIGLRELAARELLSGTGRIMDSIMMMVKLYYGSVIGLSIGHLLWEMEPHTAGVPIADWTHYIDVLLLTISLLIIFRVRREDAVWGLLAGFIAYGGAQLGGLYLDQELAGLVGALAVGVYANLYSRIRNTPTQIVLLPGIVLLVPGSKAYMGLDSMVTGQAFLANTYSGSQILMAFMAIVAGLMFANLIVPPIPRG